MEERFFGSIIPGGILGVALSFGRRLFFRSDNVPTGEKLIVDGLESREAQRYAFGEERACDAGERGSLFSTKNARTKCDMEFVDEVVLQQGSQQCSPTLADRATDGIVFLKRQEDRAQIHHGCEVKI